MVLKSSSEALQVAMPIVLFAIMVHIAAARLEVLGIL